jgi:hypothetical protein
MTGTAAAHVAAAATGTTCGKRKPTDASTQTNGQIHALDTRPTTNEQRPRLLDKVNKWTSRVEPRAIVVAPAPGQPVLANEIGLPLGGGNRGRSWRRCVWTARSRRCTRCRAATAQAKEASHFCYRAGRRNRTVHFGTTAGAALPRSDRTKLYDAGVNNDDQCVARFCVGESFLKWSRAARAITLLPPLPGAGHESPVNALPIVDTRPTAC